MGQFSQVLPKACLTEGRRGLWPQQFALDVCLELSEQSIALGCVEPRKVRFHGAFWKSATRLELRESLLASSSTSVSRSSRPASPAASKSTVVTVHCAPRASNVAHITLCPRVHGEARAAVLVGIEGDLVQVVVPERAGSESRLPFGVRVFRVEHQHGRRLSHDHIGTVGERVVGFPAGGVSDRSGWIFRSLRRISR